MKNIFKLFGLVALVAIIGFSMAACDDGSGYGPGGGGGGGGGSGGGVTLTIRDIPPQYNGRFINSTRNTYVSYAVRPSGTWIYLWACQSISNGPNGGITMTGCKISNGSVTMPIWQGTGGNRYTLKDADDVRFGFYITEIQTYEFINDTAHLKDHAKVLVDTDFKNDSRGASFLKGSDTVSWNDFDVHDWSNY